MGSDTGSVLVIADQGGAAMEKAVVAADGRLLGRVDWDAATARLDMQGPLALLALDCTGADEAVLAAVLPQVQAFARSYEAAIVAVMTLDQIDLVAASLSGPQVQLLCAPSMTERVAAVALMLRALGLAQVRDVREGNGDLSRLQRLNEEIARIADTLARLSREDAATPADRKAVPPAAEPLSGALPTINARDVRAAIRARRLRDQYFDAGLFEDPAWDILLDLFAAELEQAQVSVSSLCIAAAVAPTTALRWISKMTDARLLVRHADPFDRRRAFIALSPATHEAMRRYMGAAQRAGLSIA